MRNAVRERELREYEELKKRELAMERRAESQRAFWLVKNAFK